MVIAEVCSMSITIGSLIYLMVTIVVMIIATFLSNSFKAGIIITLIISGLLSLMMPTIISLVRSLC